MAVTRERVRSIVQQAGSISVMMLGDRLDAPAKEIDPVVGELCRLGILRRSGTLLTLNTATAKTASTPPPAKAKPAPVLSSDDGKPKGVPNEINDLTDCTVEKGVPITPRGGRQARPMRWPFASMEVGDSFKVNVPPGRTVSEVGLIVRRHAARYARDAGVDFTVTLRTATDGKSMRVWRVAKEQS